MDFLGLLFFYSAVVITEVAQFYVCFKMELSNMDCRNEYGVTEGEKMLR